MDDIITLKESIHSCDDFELHIPRTRKPEFIYSYKKDVKPKGIVFVIAGFGEDASESYLKYICEYTAQKFEVICISIFYHCFYSRYNNGATIYPDEQDTIKIKNYLNEHNIMYNASNPMASLSLLDNAITQDKIKGITPKDRKLIVTMTSFPKYDEYQNFGILQAIDHLNVLAFIKENIPLAKECPVALIGSSHGGYIANLCAKIAPSSIDLVIDNSSYIRPQYKFFMGKEFNLRDPEYFNRSSFNNILLYFFTKTYWTLDSNSKNFFSNAHFRIRDLNDEEHLKQMASSSKKPCYIGYHAIDDLIASYKDKAAFYENLALLGFNATLHTISQESQVDGIFIKHLSHAMDMSIKELINRELGTLFKLNHHSYIPLQPSTIECNSLIYNFNFKNGIYCGAINKNKAQDAIFAHLSETFTQNIIYIQEEHQDLYNILLAYEKAVEQDLYKNRFELIIKGDNIEIIDISTQTNFIGIPLSKFASIATSSVNFRRDNGLFEGFKKVDISDEMIDKYALLNIYENNLSGHADIIYFTKMPLDTKMKQIAKFVFFGVGTHIASIDEKIKADSYFIVEDNLELFKLFLFITPYYEIAKKSKILFSVFDSEFIKKTQYFINNNFYTNHYIKYFQAPHQNDDKLKEFHIQIASQSHLLFYYSSILEQYTRPLKYIEDGYKFLNILKPCHEFETKPVLLLAAGPSLEHNIQWLKENYQKFIVVAVSATMSILEAQGICPDIITHLDGFSESDILFRRVKNMAFFKKSIFLLASRTPKNIIGRLSKENIFFFESGTAYKYEHGSLTAFCVGSTTYLLLIALGVQNLYLLGLDLALNNQTGMTHAAGHPLAQSLDLSTQGKSFDTMIFNDNIIEVKGNFEPSVRTTSGFATSISSVNATNTSFKKESQFVYNLSNGAYFANTIPLSIKSNFTDKFTHILDLNIFNEFNANSTNSISQEDKTIAQNRLFYTKEALSKLHNFNNFNTADDFLNALKELIKILCQSQNSDDYDLAFIFQEYLKLTTTYIFDFFNRDIIDDETKKVQNLSTMLLKHLLDITNIYYSELEEYLCKL